MRSGAKPKDHVSAVSHLRTRAPTVSVVQLDKRTLDTIIAGVAAQLRGPGTGEGVAHAQACTSRHTARLGPCDS